MFTELQTATRDVQRLQNKLAEVKGQAGAYQAAIDQLSEQVGQLRRERDAARNCVVAAELAAGAARRDAAAAEKREAAAAKGARGGVGGGGKHAGGRPGGQAGGRAGGGGWQAPALIAGAGAASQCALRSAGRLQPPLQALQAAT